MPTADKERSQIEVLQELSEALHPDDGSLLILGGDFNLAFDETLDRFGYSLDKITNKNFRTHLLSFLESFDTFQDQDTWRVQNPHEKSFSWSRSGKMARLDYLFTPESFPGQIKET